MQPLTGRIEGDGVVKVADPRSRPNKRTAHRHGANSTSTPTRDVAGPIIEACPTMVLRSCAPVELAVELQHHVRVIQGNIDMKFVVAGRHAVAGSV